MIKLTRSEVLDACQDISDEYYDMDLKLTLRQMYYQLVSRALIENGQKSYNRVGSILTDARYDGVFPLDRIEDRGRSVGTGDYSESKDDLQDALKRASDYVSYIPSWVITRSKWWMQPTIVSVWVEKEALSGVFSDPCEDLGVSLFACKGYPSVSSLNAWLNQAYEIRDNYIDRSEPTFKILYFGDHDPDGMEIPESAERNLRKLQAVHNKYGGFLDIEFERVALNIDQINKYNPPPFAAKKSSSRFEKYLREQNTSDAWELDALEPRVLQSLIRDNVSNNFDQSLYRELQEEISDLRLSVKNRMCESDFIKNALE